MFKGGIVCGAALDELLDGMDWDNALALSVQKRFQSKLRCLLSMKAAFGKAGVTEQHLGHS